MKEFINAHAVSQTMFMFVWNWETENKNMDTKKYCDDDGDSDDDNDDVVYIFSVELGNLEDWTRTCDSVTIPGLKIKFL